MEILILSAKIFMVVGQDFIINGGDFLDDRSRFYYGRSRFSWWQVDILSWMVKISWRQLEILLWTVEILIMTGRDVYFSWHVKLFMMTRQIKNFMMKGRSFCGDRSRFYYERLRFSWWQVEIFIVCFFFWHIACSLVKVPGAF